MSWLAVHILSCDICGDRYEGKPGRARATVLAFARQTHGWHSNSHGVVIVCADCIGEQPFGGDVVMHAAKLQASDIPNALVLAELVAEARKPPD